MLDSAVREPSPTSVRRRWPIGAEPISAGQTHFRVWAPRRWRVEVLLEEGTSPGFELQSEGNGYFSGVVPCGAGALYRFRLDANSYPFPDPASRFQPEGPFGPSEVVDPASFAWTDDGWKGSSPKGRVVYELHLGTFTPEGTWRAAIGQLPRLADMGINLLEVMPVADFPGKFGWGYDGVNLFAPCRLYGRPDDFRAFVNAAHEAGVGVILDVVYNHLGPDGNFLKEFSEAYFTDRYVTDWGEAINYDGPDSGPVREFFLTNAAYWIAEYRLDGLRLDATQNIYDDGPGEHILAGISRVARAAANGKPLVFVAENEPQHTKLVRPPESGGFGLDMLWNDDFHHSARVALTRRNEAYYTDHQGRPQEFISAVKYGYLFQGQYYLWQKNVRGTPAYDLPPWAFVTFLDNHDQVANSGTGLRSRQLTSPGRYRAMLALMLLAPATPMLFQGQEFAASAPFHFFADHNPELAKLVRNGRLEFLSQFPSLSDPRTRPDIPDPDDPQTFARCKLDLSEVERNRWAVDLHRDLLRLRREDPTFSRQEPRTVDGAVLSDDAFVLRFFGVEPQDDRLLLINLGNDIGCSPMPEPLMAPPPEHRWRIRWSSEDARYLGSGIGELELDTSCQLLGESAMVLVPQRGLAEAPSSARSKESKTGALGAKTP